MEYIEYRDLSERMNDRETAKTEAGEVMRQILEDWKILHGKAICHRDLKPQVHFSSISHSHLALVLGNDYLQNQL